MNKIATKQGYTSIQGLRAIAASLVVLFHLLPFEKRFLPGRPIVPALFGFGEIGVDLFFVISGFIITTSIRGQFANRRNAIVFFLRRLTRIYPIYWTYCLILLIAYIAHPDIFSGIRGKPDILASFLLLPSNGASLLLVSWSLTFEMQFYILLTVALITLSERQFLAAASFWAVIIVGRNLFVDLSFGLLNIPFHLFNLEFLAGCFLACLGGHVSRITGLLSFVAGVALLIGGCVMFHQSDGRLQDGWPRILIAGGGFTLIMLAAVVWEKPLRSILPRMLVALGDSSYSLYLSHLLTCALVGYAWRARLPRPDAAVHVLALASAFFAALLVGWLSFRLLEQPLLKLSRLLTHSIRHRSAGVLDSPF